MTRDAAMFTPGAAPDAERSARDAYWTEPACTLALYRTLQRFAGEHGVKGVPPLPRRIWEPAAGANWIAAELEALGHDVTATDIADYGAAPNFRALRRKTAGPLLHDFLSNRDAACTRRLFGEPYAIVTNPPFGEEAAAFVRRALAMPGCIAVWMLLRNEFDCSSEARPDLFDDPRFFAKVVLRFRPKWSTPAGPIVSSLTGTAEGPRHHYAWFGWNLVARPKWPGARLLYADRPGERVAIARSVKPPKAPPAKHWQDTEAGK